MKLTQQEVGKRMQEWRNIKVLHQKAVVQNQKLRAENQKLREENCLLRQENQELRREMEDLKLQLEELRQIVFRKKKKDDDDSESSPPSQSSEKKTIKRDADSYRRPIPNPEEITATQRHSLCACPKCGNGLRKKKLVIYYTEDIPLPNQKTQLKTVVEHRVEQGWCAHCRKWRSAIPLPRKRVILGSNIKLYICYLSILIRTSNSQIIQLLRDTFGFSISNGEIARILEEVSSKLVPEFERIKKRLQEGRGVHLDETGWRRLYLWVMASVDTDEVVYLAGRNRGNGHIDELLGTEFQGVHVNDGYSAYRNKAGAQQDCWAHPNRKLKDLAGSSSLSLETKAHCQEAYQEFSVIYAKLRKYLSEPFDPRRRARQKAGLKRLIAIWRKADPRDPTKLKNIRKQFLDSTTWLTCMDYDGIPCDNNKAERMLRHFVIKRKISFGTKTKTTSHNFSILASVLMTYWKKFKGCFFQELAGLCERGV